jgi:hypothetical protein
MTTYSAPSMTSSIAGPVGQQRSIGRQILLSVVTFGLYGVYWAYISHEDVKQHSSEGVGGVVGAVLYLVAFPVTLFLLPMEIQKMYERRQSANN